MEKPGYFLCLNIIMLVLTVVYGCGEKGDISMNTGKDFTQELDTSKIISDIDTSLKQDGLNNIKKNTYIAQPRNIVSKYFYDISENTGKSISKIDNNNDGVVDCVVFKFSFYDEDGNITENLFEKDNNNDSIIDSVSSKKYIYDSNGGILQKTHEIDYGNNGIVDYISIEGNTYDEKGGMTEKIIQCDSNNDGIIDSVDISTYTYVYDENGKMLDVIIDLYSMEL